MRSEGKKASHHIHQYNHTEPAIAAKHHEENGVGYLRVRFANSLASIMKHSALQTFPTCGILLPVAPVRLNIDNRSIHVGADFRVFVWHVLRGTFVRADYFPFAIHLGSFVQVPSKLQPCGVTEMCGSTRPYVKYLSSDFEIGS